MSSLTYVVGIIGTVLSLLVFASPIKTFRRVVKNKSTQDFKGAPYIATFLCTSLWTFYGILKPGGFLVAMVNGAGATFHCIYILLFLVYSPQDKKVKRAKLVGILDVGFVAVVISVTLFLHGAIQLTFLGTLCSVLTIIMYASPLLAMKMVIKTKNVEYMPFLDSFFMLLNASGWTLYCFLIKDIFILIPNFIGVILGLAQVTAYVIYKKKPISSSGPTVTLGLVKAEMENVIEMETLDFNKEAKLKDGAMQVVKKALKRVKSHPGPMINHQVTIGKLLKTLSFEPKNNLSSNGWTNLQPYYEDDVDVKFDLDVEKYPNPSPLSYNLHTSYVTSHD